MHSSHLQRPSPPAAKASDESWEVWFLGDVHVANGWLCTQLQTAGYRVLVQAAVEPPRSTADTVQAPLALICPLAGMSSFSSTDLLNLKASGTLLVAMLPREDIEERLLAAKAGADIAIVGETHSHLLLDHLERARCQRQGKELHLLLVVGDPDTATALSTWLAARGHGCSIVARLRDLPEVIDNCMPDAVLVGRTEGNPPALLQTVLVGLDPALSDGMLLLPDCIDSLLASDAALPDRLEELAARVRSSRCSHQRKRQERLEHLVVRAALDNHAIMSLTDARGTILDVNERFCAISGYQAEELLGRNHSLLKSGEHDPAFYQEMWRTIRSGRVWRGEVCNRRKDGSHYWVESTISPLHDSAGRITGYISLRTDITRTKTQQLLLQSLAGISALSDERFFAAAVKWLACSLRVRTAFIALPDAAPENMSLLALWDDGALRPGVPFVFRDTPCAQARHQDLVVIEKDLAERFPAAPWLVENRMQSYLSVAFRDSDGRIMGHVALMDKLPMPDWQDKAEWLAVLAPRLGNILEGWRVRQQLQQQEQRFRSLANNIPGMVYSGDLEWRASYISGATAVCGYRDDDFTAGIVNWLSLVHPEDRPAIVQEVAVFQKKSSVLVQQYRIMHRDGSLRWVSDHKRSVFSAAGSFLGVDGVLFDITAQKAVELANNIHKERLSRSQHYANIGTWDWNIQSGELFWTDRIPVLFGYSEGELATTYDNFLNAIHPEDRAAVVAAVDAAVQRGQPYEIEHRVVWPDGTVRWLQERGDVIRDASGAALRMLGVVQDIDDRKRAELALAQRERELREAQGLAKVGFWRLDLATNVVHWSEQLYLIFGLDPARAPPAYDDPLHGQLFKPDSSRRLAAALQQTVQTGVPYELELETQTSRGAGWMWARGELVRDVSGKPVELRGVAQDITERKLAQAALVERERLLREAQALAHLGNWSLEMHDGSLSWSEEVFRIFGYEPEAFVPTVERFRQSVHQDDLAMVLESEKRALHSGRHDVVHRIVLPGGALRHVHELAVLERNADGSPVRLVGTVQDVTALKEAERSIIAAREEALRANRAKSEFLSSMSHELRTPMNSVLGFAQLLELDTDLKPAQSESVVEIRKAGTHLMTLINEILDLSRIESGTYLLSLEAVVLPDLVEECLALVRPIAQSRGIRIHSTKAPEYPVLADRTRLKQVLVNLLSNAIKYNREGGLVFISAEQATAGALKVCISDTGLGIPLEAQGRIFQAFSRFHEDQSRIEGTGIGLAITRKLVELMGGHINFDSAPGIGSSFWFELALAELDSSSSAGMLANTGEILAHQEGELGGSLLLVDDNPANLRLISRVLESSRGLHLFTAHSASLGLELARVHRPDLILLDINMPDMDGYKALKHIQADPVLAGVPVMALTANALPSDIERGKAAGFCHYITKPINVASFCSELRPYLRSRDDLQRAVEGAC